MKTYIKNIFISSVAIILATVTTVAWTDGRHENSHREVVEISDARIKFEINATAFDGGIQVFLDAEPWKWMKIFDPSGKQIFHTKVKGSIGQQGGTELFFESAEPEFSELSIEELLERFPEGEYHFFGKGLEREVMVGTAILTHNIPDGPNLLYPVSGDPLQDPDNTTVSWDPVSSVNGSPIIAYQVIVEYETEVTALPKVTLDVMMPATATSMKVPVGFLKFDTEYEWEVLAIEASGNQTLSSDFFQTIP